MAKTPKTPTPIESFGPELLNALIEGSKREIRIPTTYKAAVKFRQRCHQLRTRMREDKHPMYSTAARTRITILYGKAAGLTPVDELQNSKKVKYPKDPGVPALLVIAPHDSEFTKALEDAGIGVKPLDLNLEPAPTGVANVLDQYGKE